MSLLSAADAHHAWATALLEQLVRLESPSGDVEALNRCGTALAHELVLLGGRVTPVAVSGAGDHLRVEFGTPGPQHVGTSGPLHLGTSQVLVLGHFDTVWPIGQLARMPARHDDGRFYGPGAFDMKAGIVIALLAMRA